MYLLTTHNQHRVLIAYLKLFASLVAVSTGDPEGGWKIRADLVHDNGFPHIRGKIAAALSNVNQSIGMVQQLHLGLSQCQGPCS